jgi:hypothetical protein
MKTPLENKTAASNYLIFKEKPWLGRLDSNQGMAESKSAIYVHGPH